MRLSGSGWSFVVGNPDPASGIHVFHITNILLQLSNRVEVFRGCPLLEIIWLDYENRIPGYLPRIMITFNVARLTNAQAHHNTHCSCPTQPTTTITVNTQWTNLHIHRVVRTKTQPVCSHTYEHRQHILPTSSFAFHSDMQHWCYSCLAANAYDDYDDDDDDIVLQYLGVNSLQQA